MGKLIFISGGARSGKTAYALKRATAHEGKRLYIATAEPLDKEMHERIEAHKKEREGMGFDTLEVAVDIAGALKGKGDKYSAVLLDCLTLWLMNLMSAGKEDIKAEGDALIGALKGIEANVYVVSNEVGMGIVPEGELARSYRDMAGMLNAMVAAAADEAWVTISGLPLKLK